jgi:N-acetyl-gamma-glutamyl-phosphate reductase
VYAGEPFVDVWSEGLPSLRGVVGRNTLALGACAVEGVAPPLLLVVAAFDNLVKGAAGQAVQNANLMMDLCENEGLPR